jgi:hypothetical protein
MCDKSCVAVADFEELKLFDDDDSTDNRWLDFKDK